MGFFIFCKKLTEPQSLLLSIIQASKVTLPVLSGNPPKPTDISFGSSSESLTPYSTAVKPPLPLFKLFQATLFASKPWFQVEIILGPEKFFNFKFFNEKPKLLDATDPKTVFFINFLLLTQ